MSRKFKKALIFALLIDVFTAIALFLLKDFHDCNGDDCLICSLVGAGLTFVLIIAILIMAFPVIYSFELPINRIKINNWHWLFVDSKTAKSETTYEKSLVNLFVKIQ